MYTRLTISILLLLAIFWLEGVFPFFKGRKHRIKHAFPNLVFASLNGIISGLIFAWLIITAINWANFNCFGLLHTINIPLYIKGTVAFVLFDLWIIKPARLLRWAAADNVSMDCFSTSVMALLSCFYSFFGAIFLSSFKKKLFCKRSI